MIGLSDDDVVLWLGAEQEYQVGRVAGALADAMMASSAPFVVPGPVLFEMASRAVSTGLRHGADWVSIEDSAVVPQWVTKGLEEREADVPSLVSEGALPVEGVAKAVSWSELSL